MTAAIQEANLPTDTYFNVMLKISPKIYDEFQNIRDHFDDNEIGIAELHFLPMKGDILDIQDAIPVDMQKDFDAVFSTYDWEVEARKFEPGLSGDFIELILVPNPAYENV